MTTTAVCQPSNCNNFYSLSHVLREFSHCYGFFTNSSLCNHLDEELKHLLLFYGVSDDEEKEKILALIEHHLLRVNPIKYVSLSLDSPSMNNMKKLKHAKNVHDNALLSMIVYYSSTQSTLLPSTDLESQSILSSVSNNAENESKNENNHNMPIPIINDDNNLSILLNKLRSNPSIMDALTLHALCHCIDSDDATNHKLLQIIHQYLGKTHYDSSFQRPLLSDKAVEFSTSRLHTNRQILLNRLWSSISLNCLSNAFFERDKIDKKLIKCLLNDFKFNHHERVIARILYSLVIGPLFALNHCHKDDSCIKDEENKEILSVDLEWEQDELFANSDAILSQCLRDDVDEENDDVEQDDDVERKNDDTQAEHKELSIDSALDTFLEYIIKDKQLELDWEYVWKCLDDANCNHFDVESIIKMTKMSINYETISPFVQSILEDDKFVNKTGYFQIISNSLQFSLNHDNLGNRTEESEWNALQFYDKLLLLSNSNLYLPIKSVLKRGIDSSPDIVIYRILCSEIESSLKEEILDSILPTYFNANEREITLTQFSILHHSDQYLFCKYIRKCYNVYKIVQLCDILLDLDINHIGTLANYISLHHHDNYHTHSSLSFPVMLAFCLYCKHAINDHHVNWFLSNSLRICDRPFYNALLNFIITDNHQHSVQFTKLAFMQLFRYKKHQKRTQMAFLKCLLNDLSVLSLFSDDEDAICGARFNLFNKLAHPQAQQEGDANTQPLSQTLKAIDYLFGEKQFNDFEVAIILSIVSQKISSQQDSQQLLFKFITENKAFHAHILQKWPSFAKYLDKITNHKFMNNEQTTLENADPFSLSDIIVISHKVMKRIMKQQQRHQLQLEQLQQIVVMNGNVSSHPALTNTNINININDNNNNNSPSSLAAMDELQQQQAIKAVLAAETESKEARAAIVEDSKTAVDANHIEAAKKDNEKEKVDADSNDKSKKSKTSKSSKESKDSSKEKSSSKQSKRKEKLSKESAEIHKDKSQKLDAWLGEIKQASPETRPLLYKQIQVELSPFTNRTLLDVFSKLLVQRCSTDFETQNFSSQTHYIKLLEHCNHRALWKQVIATTYEAIDTLLLSPTVDEQSQQRMILRGLGSWIGKLTIGRTKPLLQKKLNLKSLIISAYEENRLIVVIPFVSKILESTIGNSIFSPPNPWLMSILSLIAELHMYVENLAVTYEIEQLFQHLNILPKQVQPTNIIRQRMKAKQHRNFVHFESLKTRIPNLVQYVQISTTIEQIIDSDKYGISNFKHIIAHGFDRCVCEIVPVCVERSIDVACICSRELVLKDTICETSSDAIRKCANQMVSTLSGALTLVICREPIKISAVQQIKKCLKDAGYGALVQIDDGDENKKTSRKPTEQQKEMNSIIITIVERNLDLVCNMAEKLAADRATKILEHNLGSLFSSRNSKTHPIKYNKNNIKMQRRVYEDFDTIRHMLRQSCRDGFTEWNLIYTKFLKKFEKLQRFDFTQQQSPQFLINDISDLLKNLLADNNDKKHETFQYILNKISENEDNKHLREALFMILTMVRDKNKTFVRQFTKQWLIQNNGDLKRILNEVILLGLLDYNLVLLDDIDKFISSLILKQPDPSTAEQKQQQAASSADNLPINIGISIIRSFVLGRKFSLSDFTSIHSALNSKISQYQSIQQLFEELKDLYNHHHPHGHHHGHLHSGPHGHLHHAHYNDGQGAANSHGNSASMPFPAKDGSTKDAASMQQQQKGGRYISYQTRVVDLLRKSFSIKGVYANKVYNDFINNEMAQFLTSQQSIQRFLDVAVKIVIGKCTEDLKDTFTKEIKDVIDAFGKLIISCIKRIDLSVPAQNECNCLMLKTFFNCVRNDIINRTKKPANMFNQRPYLRLISFVLQELSEMHYVSNRMYPTVLLTFAQFLNDLRPQKCPQFIFAWIQLLSNSKFMPKILKSTNPSKSSNKEKQKEEKDKDKDSNNVVENEKDKDEKEKEKEKDSTKSEILTKCKMVFLDLLMHLLQFVDPFWRSPKSSPSICLLFQGTLRILLVLLHDFPSFLCEHHFSLCQNIPISSFQMRNLVLSAFPKNTTLPDPFQPNLNLESIAEMEHEPKISSNYLKHLVQRDLIDAFIENSTADTRNIVKEMLSKLKKKVNTQDSEPQHGFIIKYNLSYINSIVLYLASIGGRNSSNHSESNKEIYNRCLDLIHKLAFELDSEGRYHLFNAVCNNLRYPNCHTKFCSAAILFMFKTSNNISIKEQITRILLERLVVHRPHPWGLLITFIQLIKQPEYKFWDEEFTRSGPEIESLFQTVASSCFKVFN